MAQNLVEGKIQDSKNAPLPFVDIEILTKDSVFVQSGITDDKGYFNISIQEKGEYILLAEQYGDVIFSKNLELENNLNLDWNQVINLKQNQVVTFARILTYLL